MKMSKLFHGKYLRASDVVGKQYDATISHVTIERMRDNKEKAVAYFEGQDRGIPLNKTKCDLLAKMSGSDDTDDWAGLKINISEGETSFGADTVACIEFKPAHSRKPKNNGAPTDAHVPAEALDDEIPF
jgi:hypothetical protein